MSSVEPEVTEEVVKEKVKGAYKDKVKPFLTRIKGGTSLYEVYFEKGGVIPKPLLGLFTSSAMAQRAIKLYEATRRQYY